MDANACAVIYVDKRAKESGTLTSASLDTLQATLGHEEAEHNIRTVLSLFGEVHICSDGASCITKVSQLDNANQPNPVLVLLDMPPEDDPASRRSSAVDPHTPSPSAHRRPKIERNEPSDLYGLQLLSYLASEVRQRVRSRLVILVAVLSGRFNLVAEPMRVSRYLDGGAVDIVTSPLSHDRVQGLAVHAYRRYKEVSREDASFVLAKRNRKLSWVGIDEERPYAYLREVMVSGLMGGICNPETVGETMDISELDITPEKRLTVKRAIGSWAFSAHDFNADELLFASLTMLEHALQMPELEKWRMSTADLTTFLMACRKAYNDFVLYHNFRHIVDVLQAVFYFLLQIGILPPYPASRPPSRNRLAPVATLLKPFDALTLLISAIGHDVGHPGVNNAFLVALNAPLAQLYNDRSVLEAFHCAAYSQILRRYWPQAFSDIAMRKLMINSILATDMGLHFKYMVDMGNLQEKLASSDHSIEGWTPKALEETRDLCCGLLIKCADVSNVARRFDIAAQWAVMLTDEFSNQGAMEKELNLPTCLFGGPPDRDDVVKMAESQIGFMNIFAGPLFQGMTEFLPAMSFGTAELETNRSTWQKKIELENRRGSTGKRSAADTAPTASSSASDARDLAAAQEDEKENELGAVPPLPVERDVPSDESPKGSSDVTSRAPIEATLLAERRLRNASLGSSSTARNARKTSGSGSFSSPFSMPFPHQHTGSRRSSKDAALEQLEQIQLGHMNSLSRLDNQTYDPSRRGSADASLTTILVQRQAAQNMQDPALLQAASPSRPYPRSSSQPSCLGGSTSLPPSRSNGAPHTMPNSPAVPALPLNDFFRPMTRGYGPPPGLAAENPFLQPESGSHMSSMDQRLASSAPDILNLQDANGKAALAGDDGEDGRRGSHQREIRQSRSRSRLRGLRFWRKRWKSPSPAVEVENNP